MSCQNNMTKDEEIAFLKKQVEEKDQEIDVLIKKLNKFYEEKNDIENSDEENKPWILQYKDEEIVIFKPKKLKHQEEKNDDCDEYSLQEIKEEKKENCDEDSLQEIKEEKKDDCDENKHWILEYGDEKIIILKHQEEKNDSFDVIINITTALFKEYDYDEDENWNWSM